MVVVHSGDWHITEGRFFDERVRAARAVFEKGVEYGPDLWVVAGDLFGTTVPYLPRPSEIMAVATILREMSSVAPVFVCYGNHDARGSLDVLKLVRAKHPIRIAAVVETIEASDVVALAVPYIRTTVDKADEESEKLQTLAEQVYCDLIIAHGMRKGATVSGSEIPATGEVQPPILDCVPTMLSHVHTAQEMAPLAWYAGSPAFCSFSDRDQEKVFLVWKDKEVIRVPTGAPRWVTVDLDPKDPIQSLKESDVSGCRVRLRLRREEKDKPPPRDELISLAAEMGATSVETAFTTVPSSAPPRAASYGGFTPAEKLRSYWTVAGGPPEETRREALEILKELES